MYIIDSLVYTECHCACVRIDCIITSSLSVYSHATLVKLISLIKMRLEVRIKQDRIATLEDVAPIKFLVILATL